MGENIEEVKEFIGEDLIRGVIGTQLSIKNKDEDDWEVLNIEDWIVKLDDHYEVIPADEFDKWFERAR